GHAAHRRTRLRPRRRRWAGRVVAPAAGHPGLHHEPRRRRGAARARGGEPGAAGGVPGLGRRSIVTGAHMIVLVATQSEVLAVDPGRGTMRPTAGLDDHRPTCLAADPRVPGLAWCGTDRGGVFRSDDGGATWRPVGLGDERITAITADPAEPGTVWVGTEPSAVWRLGAGGYTW